MTSYKKTYLLTLFISGMLFFTNSCGCPTFTEIIVLGDIEDKEKFIIPHQFKILEENRGKYLYNGCFKFGSTEMNKFLADNKHKFKDTLLSKIIKPTTFVLLFDNVPQTDGSLLHYRTDSLEIYADSIKGKLYISKFY